VPSIRWCFDIAFGPPMRYPGCPPTASGTALPHVRQDCRTALFWRRLLPREGRARRGIPRAIAARNLAKNGTPISLLPDGRDRFSSLIQSPCG
jgi:hypothetical protein